MADFQFINMAASSPAQYCKSMYLPPPRPVFSRQRSNSLPVGLATMNAQEADMIFSAAERATARRRRIASVDNLVWPDEDTTDAIESWPLPSESTIKPSPPTIPIQKLERPSTSDSIQTVIASSTQTRGCQRAESHLSLPSTDIIFKSLPVCPLSPTKRQVTTRSLKSYADGLFQFTQTRLVSHIPQVQSPSLGSEQGEPDSPPSSSMHLSRPSLESRFSDWSVSVDSRRSSVASQNTPSAEMDPALLSPDSFFSALENTPKKRNFNINYINNARFSDYSGYASSETYDPPSGLPLPTPPSRCLKPEAEEFSYFSNFDKYVDQDTISQAGLAVGEPPESLAINLSPIESVKTPFTPSPPQPFRRRADTAIRTPLLSRSYSSTPGSQMMRGSPSATLQVAQVAVQVPHWLIGAIS
jgi:hypothetical protein